jgi:hypothetical protein
MHERVVHSHRGELDSCHVCGQHFKGQSHESVLEIFGWNELGTTKNSDPDPVEARIVWAGLVITRKKS